jgi:DNA polymerase
MSKQTQLNAVAKEIEDCKICKQGKSGKAVPGEGNPDANIVFLGEAPGRNEAKTGRPFIGRSGKLLRSLIKNLGLKDTDVFITSPVKYLPDYITPTPKDILHGITHLNKQLDIINPHLIVLLGSTAAYAMLGEKIPILKRHGEVFNKDDRIYFLTLHPSAAMRFNKFRSLIDLDFMNLKSLLKSLK